MLTRGFWTGLALGSSPLLVRSGADRVAACGAAFGHSGDILATWETLQFLPYYSATASNVLYSYIAHDVGGHRDYGGGNDPELYTRATQYCAFSAQLRPHAAKTPGQMSGDRRFDRRPWEFGYEFFEPMREAIQLRARMLPCAQATLRPARRLPAALAHTTVSS